MEPNRALRPVDHRRRQAGHGSPSSNETTVGLDPKLLWITLRHCWMWATPTGLALAAVAAFWVYSGFVPIYESRHLLEANLDFVVFKGVMPTTALASTEKQLIYTDLVLESALADPEVQKALDFKSIASAKENLRRNLGVGNAGSNALLSISFKHSNPQTAALVCNKVTEAYLSLRDRLDSERVANLEGWLAPSIDRWKNEVQSHEERVRKLSTTALGYDPGKRVEGMEHDLTVLSSLRHDLAELVVEESVLEAQVAMAASKSVPSEEFDETKADIPTPTASEIEDYVNRDPEVIKQRALLKEREEKVRAMEDQGLKKLRQDYYADLQSQVQAQTYNLKRVEQAAREKAPQTFRSEWLVAAKRAHKARLLHAKKAVESERDEKKQQLADLKTKRAIMQQEYDNEKARLEQQVGLSTDLVFAQEDRAIASGILAQLNQRLAAIRTERSRGSGVHTMAQATVPHKPIEPIPLKKMIIAGGCGFVFPFLIGLLFEFRSQRICDAATLESTTDSPVVGEVAKLPARIGSGRRRRVFEESIDTLRSNLMLNKDTRNVRSITVASSMAAEGKSSVASQLAISVAKACGSTVLLIDADVRSPDQHDIFGLDLGPGLCKYLAGEVELEEAIDRSLGDLVHVLPAGRMLQSPHRLLSASAIQELLDRALEQYSFVVFDTAPVLAAGETLAVASCTDATLICAMRDVSRAETLLRSTRRLEAAGANLVGTVFSGVPAREYAYRYGDYRYLKPELTRHSGDE